MADPADSHFGDQYYLRNAAPGQRDLGLFRNGVSVWDEYTGAGVRVGLIDTGVDITHLDLDGNYDASLAPLVDGTPADGSHSSVLGAHGTAVAGILAAERNGVGTVGVAYDVTFVSLTAIPENGGAARLTLAQAFGDYQNFDIANNSWEFNDILADSPFNPGESADFAALTDMVTLGRGGLGTVVVKAAGNQRSTSSADLSGIDSFWGVITVGAIQRTGNVSSYSSEGAALLVSAFGGPQSGDIVTTDRTGLLGYNGISDTSYTTNFSGTSAATPMVSGIVALMLQANPALGVRDVQTILAMTARHTGAAFGAAPAGAERYGWDWNGAANWNGGALHFSEDYGFGLVDGLSAVRVAESWSRQATVAGQAVASSTKTLAVPDAIADFSSLVYRFTISSGMAVERAVVDLGIGHTALRDLHITLTSPDGTVSDLLNGNGGTTDIPDYGDWDVSFGSTAFLGEAAAGSWTLTIADDRSGNVGSVARARLTLRGDAGHDDVYVYTDEFSDYATTARAVLDDRDGGRDEVNAAALPGASLIDLRKDGQSVIDGIAVTTAAAVIEDAVGGDGDDHLIGNALANRLRGMRGDDVLAGGAGNDILDGGRGYDTADYSDASGALTVSLALTGSQAVGADQGVDKLVSIENLIGGRKADRLTGSDRDNAIHGGAGDDRLEGLGGDDQLFGDGGRDLLYGGPGNDLYVIDTPGDRVFESPGGGDDVVRSTVNFSLAAGQSVERIEAAGSAGIRLVGNSLDDRIIGNGAANALYGRDGNDRLEGGDGNDRLTGDAGADTLVGGRGDDIYYVDNAGDHIIEQAGEGDDRIYAAASFVLDPGASIETIRAQGGAPLDLSGNELPNTLVGNNAVNRLDGMGGADRLQGRGGNDIFVFTAGQAQGDVVVDFRGAGAAAGDTLLFLGYGTAAAGADLVQLDRTHWQVAAATGGLHETVTFANGAVIDPSDYLFA